jgi:hypothetical protein
MGNDKKKQQLGIPFGTACHRLRKIILFNLVKETNRSICHRCGNRIESAEDLSIDHIEPWLDDEQPIEKFFDYSNIAYSHKDCNTAAARHPRRYATPEDAREARRKHTREYMRKTYSTEKRRLKKELTGY